MCTNNSSNIRSLPKVFVWFKKQRSKNILVFGFVNPIPVTSEYISTYVFHMLWISMSTFWIYPTRQGWGHSKTLYQAAKKINAYIMFCTPFIFYAIHLNKSDTQANIYGLIIGLHWMIFPFYSKYYYIMLILECRFQMVYFKLLQDVCQ